MDDIRKDREKQKFCEGYLAALDGPEVKAVVAALEAIYKHQKFVGGRLTDLSVIVKIAERCLSQYREAIEYGQ